MTTTNQDNDMTFAPLKTAFETAEPPLNFQDLTDMIRGFDNEMPHIGAVMRVHSEALLQIETPGVDSFGSHIAEVYRRTFFDPVIAKAHGTDQLIEQGMLQQLVDHMIDSLRMDEVAAATIARDDRLQPHAAPDTLQ